MRFKSELKVMPELAASKDESRPVLTKVHLDSESSEVWVTNSYMAARFPVELDDVDTSGPIPVEALKASRKGGRYAPATSIRCNGSVDVVNGFGAEASEPLVSYPREASDYTFPNLPRLYPENAAEFEVGLDAKMLFDLARAIGNTRVRVRFTAERFVAPEVPAEGEAPALRRFPDPLRPMVVRPLGAGDDDASGLLMPIRVSA